MTHAVEVVDLLKEYSRNGNAARAVDQLSFSVRRGEIFGLLGPNGAGKTTTVGVLTTRVVPSGGTARVAGVDVAADPVGARRKVAVVPQHVNLDRSLNARQNLVFHASYHGVPRARRKQLADDLLERMGLSEKRKARVENLSGGQAQRLMIARALIHEPEVLFLDEPSTGLDPQARLFVHDRVSELRSAGVTVVLTTHDMDEAEKLSDRVGIVDHGHLLALDTPGELIRALPGSGTVEVTVLPGDAPADDLVAVLSATGGIERVEPVACTTGDEAASGSDATAPSPAPESASTAAAGPVRLRLYVASEPAAMLGPISGALTERGATLKDLSLGVPSLEDVFIHLTGRELR